MLKYKILLMIYVFLCSSMFEIMYILKCFMIFIYLIREKFKLFVFWFYVNIIFVYIYICLVIYVYKYIYIYDMLFFNGYLGIV